jgi:CRISPR-associated protein Csd2
MERNKIMTVLQNRYEFVYFFDVKDGNPNGDPDAGNLPRLDPETSQGLVTDVCLKRKVRDYVHALKRDNYNIFIQTKQPLNPVIAKAIQEAGFETYQKKDGKWDNDKAKGRSQKDLKEIQSKLCSKFFDIRSFGAVMSTGPNAGQIRGPLQLTFSRSIDPVLPQEATITRVTDVDKEEGEIGRKFIVPYGLYRAHGFVSASLASRTGFSEADLTVFWEALNNMFDHDRSAARGEMSARKLLVFKHDSALGNAPAHRLFEMVSVKRAGPHGSKIEPGSEEAAKLAAPRKFSDYLIEHPALGAVLPGVTLLDLTGEASLARAA